MSRRGRRKATPRAKRRYGIWGLGIVLAIILVATGIIASRSFRTDSYPTPTPSAFLPEIPRISVEEVKAKLDTGSNMVIVDTRSRGEYERARIAGAISIPLGESARRYRELQRYDEIITYCT